jgi:hypothetical protein
MRAKLLSLLVAVFVCSIPAAAQILVESDSSVIVNERSAEVSLMIDAKTARPDAAIELAILDPHGNLRTEVKQSLKIFAGKKRYKMQIPLGDLMKTASDEIAWYRLRYRVGDSGGIVSLTELMRDNFDLRAAAFERIVPGEPQRVRVRSLNPFTEKAVSGVAVKIELTISLDTDSEDDELKLNAAAQTNRDGFATVDFKIPDNIKPDGDGEIKIIGQKNGVIRKIDEDLDYDNARGTVFLTTDKPLYQPGQTFNVRALFFDQNNTVVPDSELEFRIEDEEDTVVFKQTVKTSVYGVAAVSWPIPENAKLGSYRVHIEADDELREDELYFKVTRYDLPSFSVTAKPDKTYYLPSHTEAQIAVNADYLFGKPVTGGKVRVVEESERHWNYREQKYDVEEGDAVEGKADASGKYVAKFDLRDEFADLQESEWQRFKDVSFSAYYTDLTTNRTEQRRFDIRLTKEPIHLYVIRYANQHADLPLVAYVSAFYADGIPAVCSVEIRDVRQVVARLKTNSLGAGKFEIEIPKDKSYKREYEINITARDKQGRQGTHAESFSLDTDDAIQIRTDQTIYKPGDMVEVDLLSTRQNAYIYVDVVKGWTPVDSQVVRLRDGRAHLSIPYKPSFKGDLMIAAYSDKEDGRWSDRMRATHGIIFPEQQNLILNAKFSKDEYRPNEDAVVKFAVADGARRPVESAIGLGIFDKAIEERARTETEFGSYFGRFYKLMGYDRSFGNLTVKDLNDLDMTRPVSPEMQLAAEEMLAGGWYYPTVFHSSNLDAEAKTLYSELITNQLKPIERALNDQYARDFDHPTDAASLQRILAKGGIDLSSLRDPWGQPYIAQFSVNRTQDIVTLKTSAADEKPDTPDDFAAMSVGFNYFTKTGEAIDRAVLKFHNRTGGYIRDMPTLAAELAGEGVDAAQLKDRWGRDYRITFEVAGRYYVVRITSAGPNGYFEAKEWNKDDFDVWNTRSDFFFETEQKINRILHEEVNLKKKPFPRDEQTFREMLQKGGVNLNNVKDGNGRTVLLVAFKESRYADKTKIENGKTAITPVTEEVMTFKIRSLADATSGYVDADLATFSSVITEQSKDTGFVKKDVASNAFTGAKGAIRGTVIDLNGAAVPGASVTAIREDETSVEFKTSTDDEGKFLLNNLPTGTYRVVVSSSGFMSTARNGVHVRSQSQVEMDLTLEIGNVSATVDVAAESQNVMDATSSATATVSKSKVNKIEFPYKERTSTPRLREYFPETLVWRPEVVTDKKGRAEVNFKMADNITTWKMFAIASTKKGKVGVVEKEVTAFQPFFVDLDPPKFLTEGDEIWLPTQVRNYTDRKQKVDVTMAKADWFTLLGGDKQHVDVATGASQNAVFGFKAVAPVVGGKQRVTAIAQSDSDAIEKPVTVRPNGEEIVQTDSKVFRGSADFDVHFPANALANTQKAELKIYPNLFSHVAESVEGLLERPYGCGEQTISSTYPNLMILKFVKTDSSLRQKAAKYLQKGYERLLGYQVADGGFTYWGGKDTSDVALTAYALGFLNDAKEFVEVDEDAVKRAENWLVRQQRTDGSWTKQYSWERGEDGGRTKLITTYVARSLAMRPDGNKNALQKALNYLKQRNAEIDEPYALALFGIASLDAGDTATAKQIAGQLEKMAVAEGSAAYWKLETNTPFYGWGTAGRIETTALAVQLLTKVAKLENRPNGDAAAKGLMFMLKNKDRYGVWYSTQTTINVLDSFLAVLASDGPPQEQTLQVSVNGTDLPSIAIAADMIEPVVVDLTGKLSPTSNKIEVRGPANSPLMSQTVATHYIDWRDSQNTNLNVGQSRALRLDYRCDKPNPAVMEDVTCEVEAERVGFKGYGMLLAQIGTPPGADVSRESLEAALESDSNLSRYDVLPDRIVLYMWSKAGGTKFNFKFKPRYEINAQTPASIVYDYYNPEAHATVAPIRFVTK